MGATMRITWPLLSLSFLFLSICSNTDSQTTPSVVNDTVTVTSGTTIGGNVSVTFGTGTLTLVTATSKLPDQLNSTGQVTTVTNNPPALHNITSGASPTVITTTTATVTATTATTATTTTAAAPAAAAGAGAVTTSPPKNMGPVTAGAAVTPKAATRQPMTPSATTTPSGTPTPAGLLDNVVTTKITKVSTVGFTSGQQSGNITIATSTSPHSIGGAEKTTIVLTGPRGTEPAGNIGATSTPSTLNKAGPTAPPLVTEAGTLPPRTPIATTTRTTNTRTNNTTTNTRTTNTTTNTRATNTRATNTTTNTRATNTRATNTTTNTRATNTRTTNTTTNTRATNTRATNTTTNTRATTSSTAAQLKTFLYSLNNGHEKEEEKDLVKLCKQLIANFQDGNCTVVWQRHNVQKHIVSVEINGKVKTSIMKQYYDDITKIPTDNKTLIAILASCGALLIMIVILAVCASHHRKPYNDNQQHLTEELHTVENGYHDNPTLEVMEVQPEMQEKKMALNGEFNDSWIVPMENLLKVDVADEEDTHL